MAGLEDFGDFQMGDLAGTKHMGIFKWLRFFGTLFFWGHVGGQRIPKSKAKRKIETGRGYPISRILDHPKVCAKQKLLGEQKRCYEAPF